MPGATPSSSISSGAPDVWVVVPAYNEALRLDATLAALGSHYRNVVVVDDGSTDATRTVAMGHGVWHLRHLFNCGQGAALQTGIDFALRQGARIVVTFDADGQHQVEDVARLLAPIRAGRADIALGSRFLGSAPGLPWSRWLMLKLGVLFTRLFSGLPVTDTHNGLRAFSHDAAARIRITLAGMAHASEIIEQIRQHRLRWCEVPVTIRYDEETLNKGQSSWNGLRIVARLVMGRIVR
ncbi:MAG: family 2 glycosyl transferase [Planctomycetes bacterium RBG_16_64_10]|nr:MAG: family 2 glycosyl transferase [Planctomycetes bacterium RBG_16_64_10]